MVSSTIGRDTANDALSTCVLLTHTNSRKVVTIVTKYLQTFACPACSVKLLVVQISKVGELFVLRGFVQLFLNQILFSSLIVSDLWPLVFAYALLYRTVNSVKH